MCSIGDSSNKECFCIDIKTEGRSGSNFFFKLDFLFQLIFY